MRFRFERLLALREEQYRAATTVVQVALAERDIASARVAQSSSALDRHAATLSGGACHAPGEAAMAAEMMQGLTMLRSTQRTELESAEQRVALARESLKTAWKKLRKLQILKERHDELAAREQLAAEGKLLDEIGLRRR